jgi:protein-tyrosine-phosphatase/predicted ATP-grasp superfamily ATP-dependent carboligase
MIRPVLILGAEPRVSVPLARSLQVHDIPVHVASLSADEPRLSSRAIRAFTRLPNLSEAQKETLDALSQLIVSQHIDMVIPTSDTTLTALLHDYDHLRNLAHLACPPPAVACRVLNKHITLDRAKQIGVPIPKSYDVSDLRDLNRLETVMKFPIVCKPRSKTHLTHPFKIRYFTSLAELKIAFANLADINDLVLQEYVCGHGVGIEVLMHQGKALVAFQHRRLKEVPSTGGRSALAISEALDPQLAEWAVQLLRALEWDGVAMVEFRCDPQNGSTALMEVNGRYWGSWALSLYAGLDFPFYQWQLAHGRTPCIPQSYTIGVRWRWTSGMLERLPPATSEFVEGSGLSQTHTARALWEGVKDYLPPTRDALWSVRDPAPAVRELSRTVMKRMKTSVKEWLRRRIPAGIMEWRRVHRTFGYRTGVVFATRRIERTLRVRRDVIDIPGGVKTILFVCYGNIIRSPMAAALLRRALSRMGREDVRVESAGLYAKPWCGADPRSIGLARESGVSLESHESTPISRDLVMRADLILVMDYLNEAELLARYPQAAAKVFLLGAYPQCHWSQAEIDDPYRGTQEDIRCCYDRLEGCVNELAQRLQVPEGSTEEQVIHAHPVAF